MRLVTLSALAVAAALLIASCSSSSNVGIRTNAGGYPGSFGSSAAPC